MVFTPNIITKCAHANATLSFTRAFVARSGSSLSLARSAVGTYIIQHPIFWFPGVEGLPYKILICFPLISYAIKSSIMSPDSRL